LQPLLSEDVFTVLKPLVADKQITVSATAATAVARIAGTSVELANDVVTAGLLEDVVAAVPGGHAAVMKAGALVFRSLAKHNAELCEFTLNAGCVPTLVRAQHSLQRAIIRVCEPSVPLLCR
jgi:hypothetical protein